MAIIVTLAAEVGNPHENPHRSADMAEPPKRRARSHMGDDDRAEIGRDHRRAPVHIDPEMTPPPQEPPRPESLAGYETLPPALKTQLGMMADELGTLTSAIGQVWDARNVAPQLAAIEAKVDGYVRDAIASSATLREFVLPAIKAQMAKLDLISSQHSQNYGRSEQFFDQDWPRMITTLEKLDKRFDDFAERINQLGRSIDTLNLTVGGVAARVTAVEAVGNSHDVRITALERRFADQDAGDKRVQALAIRRNRIMTAAWGAISTIGGAIAGWLAG